MKEFFNLVDLEPHWMRFAQQADGKTDIRTTVDCEEAQAQGIRFLCPVCFKAKGGRIGTHPVICWSSRRGTPSRAGPGPGRWYWTTADFATLSLCGETGTDSVRLMGGCGWHGYIRDGKATLTV